MRFCDAPNDIEGTIQTRKSINEKKKCDYDCGEGEGEGKQTYVEKHRVSFMYFIVDKRIFLLSAKFMVWCPYRYRCDWFAK